MDKRTYKRKTEFEDFNVYHNSNNLHVEANMDTDANTGV